MPKLTDIHNPIKIVKSIAGTKNPKEYTAYRVVLPYGISRQIPKEVWKFKEIILERENKDPIVLNDILKTESDRVEFTVPIAIAREHELTKEKVVISLEW